MEKQNTITVKIGDKFRDIKAPSSWDDLDNRTTLLYYSILFKNLGDELTHGVFTAAKLIDLTQHIIGFDKDMMMKWEADAVNADPEFGAIIFLDELRQTIHAALDGLYEVAVDEATGATTYAVRFNRTKNIWPVMSYTPKATQKVKSPKTTWFYCAKDGLANITIYEMAYTFSMYESYVESRDEHFANMLIAALYRPTRPETKEERESAWHGDRRQPLRRYEDKVEERAKMVAKLPVMTRRFLLFWFGGCREAIVKAYPRVFKRGDGEGERGNWGRLLLSLAETGTIGALGETSDQHYSNAMEYLTMKDEQAEKMKREAEKAKKKTGK